MLRQLLDDGGEAERAGEMGQLDEGRVGLRTVDGVPQRGEQVRLADAEPAVEVDAVRLGLPATAEPTACRRAIDLRREPLDGGQSSGLGRLGRIGPVRGEADVGEQRRRHQPGHQLLRRHDRRTVDEAVRHGARAYGALVHPPGRGPERRGRRRAAC